MNLHIPVGASGYTRSGGIPEFWRANTTEDGSLLTPLLPKTNKYAGHRQDINDHTMTQEGAAPLFIHSKFHT